MKVNGLELPSGFELGYTFQTKAEIQEETDKLPESFVGISPEDIAKTCKILGVQAGEIPYFWDFSKIVCFAIAGDGAPFCFDFRENETKPRIIWWADAFWQRVAPSYPPFIRLFKIPAAKRKAR